MEQLKREINDGLKEQTKWLGDIGDEAYFAMPRLSSSSLKPALHSSARFMHERRMPKEPTDRMKLGSLIHAALLYPGRDILKVMPNFGDGRTKKAQEAKAEFLSLLPAGAIAVTQNDFYCIENALKQVKIDFHPSLKVYKEEAGIFNYEGIPLKFKPDLVTIDDGGHVHLYDIKTTSAPSISKFSRQFFDLHYDLQFALYGLGIKNTLNPFFIKYSVIMAGTEGARECATLELPEFALQSGVRKLEQALVTITSMLLRGNAMNEAEEKNIKSLPVPSYLVDEETF
jgi:hypothetical protein